MTRSDARRAVLLMAYGTPETPEQVEPYYTHIRGGRAPSAEAVARLRDKYERVGGATPLLAITRDTATALERALADAGAPHRVYVGMKHWHPYIAEVLQEMARDGVESFTAIALAPHYSRMSIGGYRKYIEEGAAAAGHQFGVTFVERWHDRPEFIEMMAQLVRDGLTQFDPADRDDVTVVFSAHSLPERIRTWGDPYESELLESSRRVAEAVGIRDWRFAWQSAGETADPWIGPDILDYLETLKDEGVRNVLQVPIGFVAEHLEILWDIDYEAKTKAAELGMTLHRTALPNASPPLVRAVAAAILAAESAVAK